MKPRSQPLWPVWLRNSNHAGRSKCNVYSRRGRSESGRPSHGTRGFRKWIGHHICSFVLRIGVVERNELEARGGIGYVVVALLRRQPEGKGLGVRFEARGRVPFGRGYEGHYVRSAPAPPGREIHSQWLGEKGEPATQQRFGKQLQSVCVRVARVTQRRFGS